MLLQWSQHSQEMAEKLSSLLNRQSLLDITLAAEGQYIKAHKVVLAAASKYFEVKFRFIFKSKKQTSIIAGSSLLHP